MFSDVSYARRGGSPKSKTPVQALSSLRASGRRACIPLLARAGNSETLDFYLLGAAKPTAARRGPRASRSRGAEDGGRRASGGRAADGIQPMPEIELIISRRGMRNPSVGASGRLGRLLCCS